MKTAPITVAMPADMSGLPPPVLPSAQGTSSFSDMLASAASSLAAFALLPTNGTDPLSGTNDKTTPAPKKDPGTDNAAVPIALPTPVQTPPATPTSANPGPNDSATSRASTAPTQPDASPATTGSTSSAATSGTSNGSAQTANGVALPSMASELNTRVALGAQALLSQPSQVLVTLPHGTLQAATPTLSPNLSASAHGATPDPTAALSKLATSATVAAATPSASPTTLEAALQSSAAQTAASAGTTEATSDAAALTATSDTTSQTSADPALGATPAPAAIPLPTADAAPNTDSALPSAVAASALDQVAASLTQGSKLGLSQIELQLKPASLGTVDVKLELTHDGRVAAVISADRSDTLMQLQRGSGELQQALRDAGLQTDSGSLSFNLRGDAQTSDQSGRQPSYATPQPAASSGSDDDLLVGAVPVAGAIQTAHSGLLNIQV
ncbi:MAG: flagellar hook-length control protein FliK [Stellaceae bacterium]